MVYELIKALEDMRKYNETDKHKEAMLIIEKLKEDPDKVKNSYRTT